MNNIKYFLLLISILMSTISSAQEEVTALPSERVIVFHANQAIVAVLDADGFVLKEIIDLPAYFTENYSDEHYIAASYASLSDVQLEKELKKSSDNQLETLASTKPRFTEN